MDMEAIIDGPGDSQQADGQAFILNDYSTVRFVASPDPEVHPPHFQKPRYVLLQSLSVL